MDTSAWAALAPSAGNTGASRRGKTTTRRLSETSMAVLLYCEAVYITVELKVP